MKRLLVLVLSAIIIANSAMPAFATETDIVNEDAVVGDMAEDDVTKKSLEAVQDEERMEDNAQKNEKDFEDDIREVVTENNSGESSEETFEETENVAREENIIFEEPPEISEERIGKNIVEETNKTLSNESALMITEENLSEEESVKFAGGTGTIEDPYQIVTVEQLFAVHENTNAHYIQMADIDLQEKEWSPIGYLKSNGEARVFAGSFNGNGFKIENIFITKNLNNSLHVGFFASNMGIIKNVILKDITIELDVLYGIDSMYEPCVGGIAGSGEGLITNCSVTGTIAVKNAHKLKVGGIIGAGECFDCKNYATIKIESAENVSQSGYIYCGGITGQTNTINNEIRNCINYGNIDVSSDTFLYCGGISGAYGAIENCVNYGNVSGKIIECKGYNSFATNCNVGGIVGATSSDKNTNCVNYGNISAKNETVSGKGSCAAGGIVGFIGYYNDGTISYCYNLAETILADGDMAGRIAGFLYPEKTKECYSIETTYVNEDIPKNTGPTMMHGGDMNKGEIEYEIRRILSIFNNEFNEYIYRTDYLLDKSNPSNLEYYKNYINKFSPAQTFTEVNKLESANELWRSVTLLFDTAADISALSEYYFDQEDVYTTIIINALEESTSYKMLDSTAKTIASDSTKIVGHIVDILESEYNINLGVSEGYSNLSYEKKEIVYEVLEDSLKEGGISGIVTSLDEAGKYIDEFIDASDCIESFVNNVLTYANIYSVTDSMADVLDEMYIQAPDDSEHLYMRRALQSCSDLIRASKDEFLNEIMIKGAWTSAGRYVLKKTMSFFWDKLKNAAITADPALGFLLACYKGSHTITDKLCNIDDVSEQSYKLSVIKQYYTILNDTVTALTRKYKSSVSEKNAEAVLNSLKLLFKIADEDCDIADKYVDVIEDAEIRDILSFLQIDNSNDADNYTAAHEYIKNIKSEYDQARQSFETEWIYQLESDFPQWYEQYKELIGEKQSLAVPVASYAIECPVNVSVYNDEGAIVAYLRDNKSYATGNVTVSCYENKKYVDVYDDEQYHIVCDGYDTGTMDVFVTEYEEDNVKRQVAFYDLIVENNKIFELQREESVLGEEEYIIATEDVEIAANYDSNTINENDQAVHVKIEGGYIETLDGPKFEVDAYPGEKLEICAYVPEGNTFLGWYSNGGFLSENERCEFVVADTVNLIAVIEGLNLHKINYFDNDAPMNLEPRTFLESEYVNLPVPKKEGYKFRGWYLTEDLLSERITEIVVGTKEDVTLYASWKSVSQYEEYAIENISNYIYTGTQIKPLPVVYDNETVLKLGEDYTLSYRNNTEVGTAQIIIKGKGNYTKTVTVEFEILPKDISEDDISITCADKLYNGKKQVSKPSVKWNKKTLKAGTDYTVRYSGNQIAPGEVTVTLTGKGNYTGVVETSYRITDKDISKAVIDKLSAQNYTGVEIEPEVVLYANKTAQKNGEALIQGIDYEVKYENNVKSGKGKIVITGINAYGGTKTVAFTINKRTIVNEDVEITFAESDSMEFYATYTGVAQKPQIVIIDQGQMLEEGLDYKLSYANNTKAATVDSKNKPTVTITGMGNYSGTKKVYFNILPMDFLEKDDLKITVTDAKYTGKAVKPAVKVNIGDKTLKKDSDYKVVGYYNNVDLCEKYQSDAAYVVVKGINNYSGEMMVPFRIYAAPASLFVVDKITAQAYTPHEVIEPEIFVYEDKAGQKDGILLTEGIDYEIVDYVNNDKAGTAKVTVTGIGQYGGTKTISFTINKCNLATEGIHVEVEEPVLTYTGNSLKSLVSVVDGDMELIEGVDYTVTYSNNKNVPKNNKNLPTIVIKGKGNYTGTLKETFAIEPKNIADDSITVTAKDVLFSAKSANSSKGHTTTITVMDGVKKLSTSNYKVKGYLNNKLAGDTLDENAPTVLIEGIGNYTGTKEVPFRIFEKNISKVTVEKIPSELYTGKAIEPKPVVTIKLSKTETITLVEGEDYTITYDKNVKIGKAKVTIIGMGEYGGSKSVTFTILPKWLKWFA